jgi:hypothetical protein
MRLIVSLSPDSNTMIVSRTLPFALSDGRHGTTAPKPAPLTMLLTASWYGLSTLTYAPIQRVFFAFPLCLFRRRRIRLRVGRVEFSPAVICDEF